MPASYHYKSQCTPKALSLGVERQILGVKFSALVIHYVACTKQATRCGVQDTQRAGLAQVLIYWGTKVWNIDLNFVVFKK